MNDDTVANTPSDANSRSTIRKRTKGKVEAASRIVEEHAKLENPNTSQHARTHDYNDLSDSDRITQMTQTERLDKAIDKSLKNKEMIQLDEAFPDVGIYEDDGRSLPTAPAVRARQASIHGTRYQREYILRTVHRLALRRVPVDQIAQMFNVQVLTVYKWMDELKERLKAEATTMSVTQIAGDTLSFYNEARAMGMTIASSATKVPEKVRGMEVALKAEADKHKFLQVAGFYDTAKLGRETMEDTASKKARSIINMTKNLLSGNFEAEPEEDISDMIDPEDRVIL